MTKPRLLDLFCGAGGAAVGYHRAGFDVTGVDIEAQPHYPFEFHQGDAMTFPLDGFDAVHASPPCQDFVIANGGAERPGTGWMLPGTRERLTGSGLLWVIENVPGAPMRVDYRLCGCMFGLGRLRRQRWFETSWRGFDLRSPCHHPEPAITITTHGQPNRRGYVDEAITAMGIDWMNQHERGLAIPPAYTEYIGRQMLTELEAAA